jgi:hypothetical protein
MFRIILFALAAGLFGVASVLFVDAISSGRYPGVGTAAIFAFVAFGCWRAATARFMVEEERFVIRNYFKTWRIPIRDVITFEVGDAYGIRAVLKSGGSIQINAIQRSERWMGTRVRQEDAVKALNELVAQAD